MIIKSLSRRSIGATRKVIGYVLKYSLKEELHKPLEKVEALKAKARTFESSQVFEKSLKEAGVLGYKGVPAMCATVTNGQGYGLFGKGFYMEAARAKAKGNAGERGVVQKYVIDEGVRLYDLKAGSAKYAALWKEAVGASPYVGLHAAQERIREHLLNQGYGGIRYDGRVMVFDAGQVNEMPKGIFGMSRAKVPKPTTEIAKLILRHGLKSTSLDGYVEEFSAINAGRIHVRSNNIDLIHFIISYGANDKAVISDEVLRDTAEKFVELYGKEQPYIFAAHYSKAHVHLHAVVGSVRFDGYSSRVSKALLEATKIGLTSYIKDRYPQIQHSFPEHGRAQREKDKAILVKAIRNERLHHDPGIAVRTLVNQARSQEQFFSLLKAQGYVPYMRNGAVAGIQQEDGLHLKFRLSRMGISREQMIVLDNRKAQDEKALSEIQALRGIGKEKVMEMPAMQEPERTKEETALSEISDLRENAGKEMEPENDNAPEMEFDEAE